MDYSRILYSEISFVNGNNIPNSHNLTNGKNCAAATNNHSQNGIQKFIKTNTSISTNDAGKKLSDHITSKDRDSNNNNHFNNNEQFQAPKQQLCDPRIINLNWLQSDKIGGGLINIGNTCFLNSVLQCLTYCPPLHNYLTKYNGGHSHSCKINQFCMLCEMERHIKRIKNSNSTPIKPVSIVQRLKYISKSFQYGRQEDAHEFLRYVIDHMWKACLMNLDIKSNSNKIDSRIKETTAINHIFGGYHRSQVLCLSCNNRSNTFDFFMDFILDIRNVKSLEEALKKFTQPETLENENAYRCEKCKRKVTARKRFSVYKAPNVATFQLKRFDSDRIFGGKVTKFVSYPEELDLRPYMSDTSQSTIKYQLNAVLVHVGHSSNSGHYFCYIKNSNGCWYRMDDSDVTLVNKNNVLQQQAYVLFYTRKTSDTKIAPSNGFDRTKQQNFAINSTSPVKNNASTTNSSILNLSNVPRVIPTNGYNNKPQTAATNGKPLVIPINGVNKPQNPSALSTWSGARSKLEEEETGKRKARESIERDKFNEELDRGKRKKVRHHKIDKFLYRSKVNPFQFIRN